MKTLVYAPRVEAYIRMRNGQILDISKDIASGTVRRVTNDPSSAQLTLNNRGARYSGKLAIMDAIHIRLFKGKKEYPVFTGYLTTVPVYDVFNTTVTIEAQCTLKQIVHTYWDPNSAEAIQEFIGNLQPLKNLTVPINPAIFGSTETSSGEMLVGGTDVQNKLVSFARSKLGKYRYSQGAGRDTPDTSGVTDCSGFVRYVYKQVASIDVGSYTGEQIKRGTQVLNLSGGQAIDESKLQPGDLILYNWPGGRSDTDHVEMYAGNGKVIGHGGPGMGPTEKPITYGQSSPRNIRRYVTSAPSGNASVSGWVKPSGGSVSSPYGWRIHPIYGTNRLHDGIDYAVGCGSPIYAAASGTVEKTGSHSSMGNYIVLKHSSTLKTRYLHIQPGGILVKQGQAVNAGQQIAKVGTTGDSTGCHLHFTVLLNDKTVDPAPYLSGAKVSTGNVTGPATGVASSTDFWKANPDFDARTAYYTQQGQEGMNGVRLKAFLNKVCDWPYENILIEAFPDRLANLVKDMNIVEGASDPEEALQQIYRLLMGDTFATSESQSSAAITADGFSGSEGGGDIIYTKTMYGIGMAVSKLNYKASSSYLPGDGAYGFAKGYASKTKSAQDAAMLSELKSFVSSGTAKSIKALTDAYGKKRLPNDPMKATLLTTMVIPLAASAPVPSASATTTTTAPTPSLESGMDLFLKGMRMTESSDNYKAQTGQYKGAYMFSDKEWNGYAGYSGPLSAPNDVQDKFARETFTKYYNMYGVWDKAAAHHHYPAWANDRSKWDRLIPGNPISLNTYVKRVMRYMTGTESLDSTGATGANGEAIAEVFDQSFYAFFRSAIATNMVPSEEAMRLSGEKALMNDVSAFDFAKLLSRGSMREIQSDPNGNFTSFYPDYFGWYYPDRPIVKIQDLELVDFKIRATDRIYSHVYVVDGSTYPDLYNIMSDVSSVLMKEAAEGVVTLENEALIGQMLGMKPAQAKQFLQLYGARPYVENRYEILNKTFARLYSLQLFLSRWAGQYNTVCEATFMPELWPGTRAAIADTGVGVYIDSVTHSFSYSSGFTTSFVASCPQRLSDGTVIDSATGLWLPDGDNSTLSPGRGAQAANNDGAFTPPASIPNQNTGGGMRQSIL